MRRPTLRLRSLLIGVALLAVILAIGVRWYRSLPVPFHHLVSRAVPRGGSLSDLEAVAGPAQRLPGTDRLARFLSEQVIASPGLSPDGWREDDAWAVYHRDDQVWGFQLRDGRIINYDPARLERMRPQKMNALSQ